jgi:hypothetical protein
MVKPIKIKKKQSKRGKVGPKGAAGSPEDVPWGASGSSQEAGTE